MGHYQNMSFFSGRRVISTFVLLFFISLCRPADSPAFEFSRAFSDLPKEKKVLAANAAGMLFVTTWGIVNWDYGDRSPHARNERWFSRNTKSGGVDKLAHLYDNYAMTHGLAWLYESWGYNRDKAARYGAFSSFGILGYMELGDSFSDFGFSYEDFLMNTLGSLVGYLFYLNPALSEKLDFRVEFWPDSSQGDFITDYDNQKYLAALKLDGFKAIKNKALQYLELHLGYYTRGYSDNTRARERNIYFGVGVNLAKIFDRLSYKKTAVLFNYYQPPYTTLKFENDFNR